MSGDQKITYGSVVEFKKQNWLVRDWCKPCKLVWLERLGEKKRAKYSEVKFIAY